MLADLRFAARQLTKSPGFTAVALVTLALGLGSATVVFSTVNALLFKPLPLVGHAEDRLISLNQTLLANDQSARGWNYPDYADLRSRLTSVEGLWIYADLTVIITGKHAPERRLGTEITWDAFPILGVHPQLGRPFSAADSEPGAPAVALISDTLWRSRFSADPTVVGSVAHLNGQPTTIIGVMPPIWRYPDESDVWYPLRTAETKTNARGYSSFMARGLLKPDVTLADAQIEASTIMAALALEHPATNSGIGVRLRPFREEVNRDTAHLTLLLLCAVFSVFLIACVNVANLLLARAVSRAKEISIRLALGAERRRVVRQLITENLLLALCGGVLGLVLALWANDAMVALIPPMAKPFWLRFEFDTNVFLFVFSLSTLAAVLFGLAPALKASRPDLVNELKEGGRAEVGGPRATRLRNALVIIEVALALVLLVGAGLMMRSFLHLKGIHPGFDARNVLTFRTGFPRAMAPDETGIPRQFFSQLVPRLESIPGVTAAGLVSHVPGMRGQQMPVHLEGRPAARSPAEIAVAQTRLATPGYFSTLRVPVILGRMFDDTLDRPDTTPVALVDETFALRYFGGAENALGRRVRLEEVEDKDKPPFTIVGVVGNVRHQLDRDELLPTFYRPVSQVPDLFLTVVMRTEGDPARYIEAAREAVLSVNSSIPIYHELTLSTLLRRTIWTREFFSFLFSLFGLVALALACIGIYGVMAYNVTQRTQEIGVRMALGAQSTEVVRMVVRRGLRLVGWGLGAGFAAALLLANLLTTALYGVSPHDPPTFALVPLLLAAVALIACWLPARRATRVNPVEAIRLE